MVISILWHRPCGSCGDLWLRIAETEEGSGLFRLSCGNGHEIGPRRSRGTVEHNVHEGW